MLEYFPCLSHTALAPQHFFYGNGAQIPFLRERGWTSQGKDREESFKRPQYLARDFVVLFSLYLSPWLLLVYGK
jgi:hypothetical protein